MFLFICLVLALSLQFLFFICAKSSNWSVLSSSSFECGFSSYFYSRFSFSIHYFLIALTFLFLDLELCFLLPLFNEDFSLIMKSLMFFCFFSLILTLGLLYEWKEGFLEWKS